MAIAVNAALPVNSVAQLIAYAKAHPGKVNFATAPQTGATTTVATKLFAHLAGITILEVPYTSNAARMTALMGGEVQAQLATAASFTPFLKSKQVKILGVAAKAASSMLPGVAVIGSQLPGFETDTYNAVFAPAQTPAPILARLNKEVLAVMAQPDVRQKFLAAGLEPKGSNPADLTKAMRGSVQRVSRIVGVSK